MSPGGVTGACKLVVTRLPSSKAGTRRVAVEIARWLAVSLGDAERLLERIPSELPKLGGEDCAELGLRLQGLGAATRVDPVATSELACATHPAFMSSAVCSECARELCTLCRALAGRDRCGACNKKAERKTTWFRVRVTLLSAVLGVVVLFAAKDVHSRRTRTEWSRPLRAAIVVVDRGGVPPSAFAALAERVPALEKRLNDEFVRYRGGGRAFELTVFGPVRSNDAAPDAPEDGWIALARYNYDLWRFRRRIDALGGIASDAYDSTVYVLGKPAAGGPLMFVEGRSQDRGRIGVVDVQLDPSMTDFALAVTAHELFHTLGASDRYDAAGRATLPDGLAEPDRVPRYPQRYFEVMARGRPVSPGIEEPPQNLDELCVGPATALEIGWRGSAETAR